MKRPPFWTQKMMRLNETQNILWCWCQGMIGAMDHRQKQRCLQRALVSNLQHQSKVKYIVILNNRSKAFDFRQVGEKTVKWKGSIPNVWNISCQPIRGLSIGEGYLPDLFHGIEFWFCFGTYSRKQGFKSLKSGGNVPRKGRFTFLTNSCCFSINKKAGPAEPVNVVGQSATGRHPVSGHTRHLSVNGWSNKMNSH